MMTEETTKDYFKSDEEIRRNKLVQLYSETDDTGKFARSIDLAKDDTLRLIAGLYGTNHAYGAIALSELERRRQIREDTQVEREETWHQQQLGMIGKQHKTALASETAARWAAVAAVGLLILTVIQLSFHIFEKFYLPAG